MKKVIFSIENEKITMDTEGTEQKNAVEVNDAFNIIAMLFQLMKLNGYEPEGVYKIVKELVEKQENQDESFEVAQEG